MRARSTLFYAVCGAVFSVPAAAAPSFDCGKASGFVETEVCKDEALAALDQKLAAAYAAALQRVSEPGRLALRDTQREWLRYLAVICSPKISPKLTLKEVDACLAEAYAKRVEQLEKTVTTAGDLTFRRVDVFKAQRSDPADQPEWAPAYETLEVSYPQIERPKNKSEELFNKKLADQTEQDARNFAEGGSDIGFSFETIEVSDKLISLDTTSTYYGHGAAHGIYSRSTVNWLRQEGRELQAEDVFAKTSNWRGFLRDTCYEAVKREGFVEKPDDLNEMPEDPHRWRFGPDGLTISFNVYEVASYADGIQEVRIGWSAMKPYLAAMAPVSAP